MDVIPHGSGSTARMKRHALAFLCAVPLLLTGAKPMDDWAPIENVLIVTLDTTRADYLWAYGSAYVETPALDRLAREGIVFEQATTSAPLTLPAHCTLFTGLLPPHHHVRDNADRALADTQTTLAEALRTRGMRTAAFVGSIVVGQDRGLTQGFDTYSAPTATGVREGNRRPGQVVVDDALAWLKQETHSPFFAWVHLYDAHAPYAVAEPYRTRYQGASYLGALAVLDAQVARLVEALEARHALDRTLIIVAGDHGESLGDHGEDGHGIFVYQSTLHVPLIMRVPGLTPRRVPDVTRLADVMPTVLDLLHLPKPSMDGVSLSGLMTGRTKHLDLDAYSESAYPRRFGWSELHALRAGRFKYISAPKPELYDLDADPGEQHNIVNERTALGSVMAAKVNALAETDAPDGPTIAGVDADASSRLAALGYVAHGTERVTRAPSPAASAIDPKDCIGRYNEVVRAQSADWASPSHADGDAASQKCGVVMFFSIPRHADEGSTGIRGHKAQSCPIHQRP